MTSLIRGRTNIDTRQMESFVLSVSMQTIAVPMEGFRRTVGGRNPSTGRDHDVVTPGVAIKYKISSPPPHVPVTGDLKNLAIHATNRPVSATSGRMVSARKVKPVQLRRRDGKISEEYRR